MAFKDGGSVKKITPPPPAADRPAVGGYHAPDNQNISTYHGTTAPGKTESPSSPMPGPGGPDKITLTPLPTEQQETIPG